MQKPIIVVTGEPGWQADITEKIGDGFSVHSYSEQARYIPRLAEDRVALILVDGSAADWQYWTTTPKSSPATRRIPVVTVADDDTTRKAARVAGANLALTVAELRQQLPDLLRTARIIDPALTAQLEQDCQEVLPPLAREGVEKFNAGEYYKQHDLFEALWVEEERPVRDLYRAILQVGVAYYQVKRKNQRGALKMLLRSLQWLALLPDACQGVDVAQLKADAAAVQAELERVGADGIDEFDLSLLKPVKLIGD